jgi:hypothetical protein
MTMHRSESPEIAKQQKLNQLCWEISEYLRNHPNAGDTATGISEWWLGGQYDEKLNSEVEEALHLLMGQGLVVRSVLCDGTFLYKGTGHRKSW